MIPHIYLVLDKMDFCLKMQKYHIRVKILHEIRMHFIGI